MSKNMMEIWHLCFSCINLGNKYLHWNMQIENKHLQTDGWKYPYLPPEGLRVCWLWTCHSLFLLCVFALADSELQSKLPCRDIKDLLQFVQLVFLHSVPSLPLRVGAVYSIKMLLEHQCAFVNYTRKEDCERAIQAFNVSVCEASLKPHWGGINITEGN